MDKNAIKTFAIESRRQMIESVKYQASLIGVTAECISEPISKAEGMETYDYGAGTHTIFDKDIKKRESLIQEVKNKGFNNVMEEVSYTWFNRIIAIRYMEVNDYLPTRTRVLSSEIEGKIEPDIITDALDIELNYAPEDKELILKYKDENKLDLLFQFLFVKQCNKLNEILPGLFEKTDDWMELLLDINFTNNEGIVSKLITNISEEDFRNQVEIIGWIYQYYISERKDEIINIYKGNVKKEDIPSATQLFTPEWVVKFMVDNSLGKYWIERNDYSKLKNNLVYYFGEAEQTEEVQSILNKSRLEKLNIEDLKFFDPCMGSGHILVYAFDVFFEIYKELGYSINEIPELILKNNIYGLDVDDRAYQLAYFSILMKARTYDKRIFKKNIIPNVFSIQESENISNDVIKFISKYDLELANNIDYLRTLYKSGKEFGSLIQVKNIDFNNMKIKLNGLLDSADFNLSSIIFKDLIENDIVSLINQSELLNTKYDIVVTNPPYMNKFEKTLKDFSKKNYEKYSKDLFSMFIYRNFMFCKKNGYSAMITPFVWMFLKTYEDLRKYLIKNKSISSLVQLEYNSFNEIAMVPVGIYVFLNSNEFNNEYNGIYLKLSEFKGDLNVQKNKVLDAIDNEVNYKFYSNSNKFINIPGSPIAYWPDENFVLAFKEGKELQKLSDVKAGISTGDNKRFLKYWFEVDWNSIYFKSKSINDTHKINYKWFPYKKGGSFRKWFGNNDYVLDWENDGEELKKFKKATIRNINFQFMNSLSWSEVSNAKIAFRKYPNGFLFDGSGSSIFINNHDEDYILGFLNSSVCQSFLDIISPTIHYTVGSVSKLPVFIDSDKRDQIENIVKENVKICENDYNDYEYSWNFKSHPFLLIKGNKLEDIFEEWKSFKNSQFNQLKTNEVILNELFAEIYNMDVDCQVQDKHVSVILADYEADIRSFISYAVGCMFGRYSLDSDYIQFAGGHFNINNYPSFKPDNDNIIPVLDAEYFEDDIVGRFVEFVKTCFGEETLEENLNFIANALNKKGKTSREVIRNYFLTEFFKNHVHIYKKNPIYWQFDSGKQNAFKCLVYMHRYETDLVARIRTDYLHKTQKAIEQNLARCDNIISNSSNKSEVTNATKDKTKYIKQLDEIRNYDEVLSHIANQHISIDLNDGVKVNYNKFQKVEISRVGEKTKKINLLKKI